MSEIKPVVKEKDSIDANQVKLLRGKKAKINRAAAAFSALLLAGSLMACEGNTDLSSAEVKDDAGTSQPEAGQLYDAGVPSLDVGHKDAGPVDAGADAAVVADGGQQDAGHQCISTTTANVLLKLSVAGNQVFVKMGDKVQIGDKEYTATLSSNNGDLLLRDENGDVTVIARGKAEVVNGYGVKLMDQSVDEIYYTSRVLLNAVSGEETSTMILSEDGTAKFKVGEFDVELTSKGVESWDEEGDILVADLKVVTPDYTLTKEGVRIGKDGYSVTTESGELVLDPIEFGDELYQDPNAPKDLCAKTTVAIGILVDDSSNDHGESSIVKVSKNITLKLGKAFIGSSNGNTMVEVEINVAGKEPEQGLYHSGQMWQLVDGTRIHTVTIGKIDFETVSTEDKDGGSDQ